MFIWITLSEARPTSAIKSISGNTESGSELHSRNLSIDYVVPPSLSCIVARLPPADVRPDEDGQGEPGDRPHRLHPPQPWTLCQRTWMVKAWKASIDLKPASRKQESSRRKLQPSVVEIAGQETWLRHKALHLCQRRRATLIDWTQGTTSLPVSNSNN